MGGLDLTGVTRFLDSSILVDTVVVGRAEETDDDVDESGQVVPGEIVWVGADTHAAIVATTSQGFSSIGTTPDVEQVVTGSDRRARLFLRSSSGLDVQLGDHVWALTANAPVPDPSLPGFEWEVIGDATPASFLAARILSLKVAGRPIGDPPTPIGVSIFHGDGPPPEDLEAPEGSLYIDDLTGQVYQWEEGP